MYLGTLLVQCATEVGNTMYEVHLAVLNMPLMVSASEL